MRSVLALVLLIVSTTWLAPALDARVPQCPNARPMMMEAPEHAAVRHFERLQCLRGLPR